MTDTQLAEYIVHIMCLNNFRSTTKWALSQDPRLGATTDVFTAVSHESSIWTQITYAVRLLRTWIDNPAAALAYLTAEETSKLRLMIAVYFLEHGVP